MAEMSQYPIVPQVGVERLSQRLDDGLSGCGVNDPLPDIPIGETGAAGRRSCWMWRGATA